MFWNKAKRFGVLLLTLSLISISARAQSEYTLETVAEGLNFPWSIAFLPGGDYLVAMRSGEVRNISADGNISEPITGLPESYVMSQGGYFDITADPDFISNQRIYLSLAHGTPEANGTRIVTGTLKGNTVTDVTPIFTVTPLKDTPVHYGGKMLFQSDGTLMMTTGDGFEYREAAQDPHNLMGKIIRINTDGSIPADNPFADGDNGHPAVWSFGHRNPQGLDLDPATDQVYAHEHGAKGGDELNLIKPSVNYGWPAVTKGKNYSGAYVSPLRSAPSLEEPLTHWTPSIGASGLAIYRGDAFPQWRGKHFVGALVAEDVRMLTLDAGEVTQEEIVFSEIAARIRDVRVSPAGMLYLLTDSDQGKVVRVTPTLSEES